MKCCINMYPRGVSLVVMLLCVMGINAQTKLQYWYDDEKTIRQTDIPVSGTLKGKIDVHHLPQGLHTIYMRVKQPGAEYKFSPITTSTFIKFAAGEASVLQYWFDEDVDNLSTIDVDVESGEEQVLILDLSALERFPLGVHRLNMRVAAAGSRYSPIYSAIVMRLRSGPNNYLTYWLDNDFANRRHTWSITGNGRDAFFKARLDFPSASAGMHRLHYRIASKNQDDGPIYEVPILITQMYNNETDVVVTNQSYWLDDVDVKSTEAANSMKVFTHNYSLNPSQYAEGQHAFHMQFENSAGVWSAQNVTYFYKDASGMLRAGFLTPEDDLTAINENAGVEHFACYYRPGTVVVDCQSSKLAATGVVMVCDLTGRVVVREEVDCSNGMHTELNVNSTGRQMLIVKVHSGDVHFNKKLITK